MKSNVFHKRGFKIGVVFYETVTLSDWLAQWHAEVVGAPPSQAFISCKSRLTRQEIFSLSFAHPCIDLSVETIMKVKI